MNEPNWRNLDLHKGLLREAVPQDRGIVVWLPSAAVNGVGGWRRVSSVPGTATAAGSGLCASAGTVVHARQRVGGLLGSLLARLQRPTTDRTWLLPNGQSAQQQGERQTDALLV